MDFFVSPTIPKTLLFFCILLPCAAADMKTCRAPRPNLQFLIFVLIAASPPETLTGSIFGAVWGLSVFLLARKLTGNGLGLADAWTAGAVGALGGAGFCAGAAAAAVVLTLPRALFLIRRKSRQPIPFLPSLAAGSFFFLLAGVFAGRN